MKRIRRHHWVPIVVALCLVPALMIRVPVALADSLVPCGQQIAWSTYALWMQSEEAIPVLETVLPPAQTGSTCGGGVTGFAPVYGVPLSGVWEVSDQAPDPGGQMDDEGEPHTVGDAPVPAPSTEGDVPASDTGADAPAPGAEEEEPVVLTGEEALMLELVNAERTKAGLSPLALDSRLVGTARAKSADMVANNYFSHISPTLGSPFDQLEAASIRYRAAAENLAASESVASAHQLLLASSLHRANLLNPNYTHIGIGVVQGGPYGLMVTQHFISE